MLEHINNLIGISSTLMLLILVGLYLLKGTFYLHKDAEICPNCKKWRTQEKVSEKQLGVFQKGHSISNRGLNIRGTIRMVKYEKYKIQYKCKHCGHEWEII
jgi:hypothetical protein